MQYFPQFHLTLILWMLMNTRKNLFSHNRAEVSDIFARDEILNLLIAVIRSQVE